MVSPTVAVKELSATESGDAVRGLLGVTARRWPLLAIGLVVGAACGFGLYALTPPVFSANTQLLLNKKRPEAIGVESRELAEDYVATHQGLLRSPLIVDRAIHLGNLSALPAVPTDHSDLREWILKNLTVVRQKDSMGIGNSLMTISFRSQRPESARAVLEGVLKAYQELLADLNARSTDESRELFLRSRDVLQKELAEKEAAYREFRRTAPLAWKGKDGANTHQERLVGLEARRTSLMLRQSELEGKLTVLEAAIRAGQDRDELLAMAAEFAAPSELETMRQGQTVRWKEQILQLLQQEGKLTEKLGPEHPEVQAIRTNLATARAFLNGAGTVTSADAVKMVSADPVSARVTSLRQELDQLRTTATLLGQLCQLEQQQARTLLTYEIEDDIRRNEIQRTTQLFDTLLKRLQDANLVKDAGGLEARVVAAPGSDGIRRLQPNLLICGSLGLLLGLMFGGSLALGAELRDDRYRSLSEIQSHLRLPVLCQVPLLPRATLDQGSLVSLSNPTSAAAEAFRGARTVLLAESEVKKQVVQVTSPQPGQGKTLVSCNLAISLAQAGKSVVLIDGNLARPRVAVEFHLEKRPGLLAVLEGKTALKEALRDGPIAGLAILIAEEAVGASGDCLASSSFEAVIAELRSTFDFILIDGPAALGRADASILARCSDTNLLIVEMATSRSIAARVVDTFGHTSVLGTILNRARPEAPFLIPTPHLSDCEVLDEGSSAERRPSLPLRRPVRSASPQACPSVTE